MAKELITFFENDSVSRICPGKRDVIKRNKITKQRRVLLDTLKNLHVRFQEETKKHISLTSFTRSRPFWVTFPKRSDRETCGCIKHENFGLIIQSLKTVKVIKEKNTTEVIRALVCSVKNKTCMLGECQKCRNKDLAFFYNSDFSIKYYQWTNVKEERMIKEKRRL